MRPIKFAINLLQGSKIWWPSSTATKYLHPLQEAYERKLVQQKKLEEDEQQTRQKNKYKKRITTITKELDELIKYDEKLQHVANLHIDLDLDDGVLVNYAKAQADTKILTPLK